MDRLAEEPFLGPNGRECHGALECWLAKIVLNLPNISVTVPITNDTVPKTVQLNITNLVCNGIFLSGLPSATVLPKEEDDVTGFSFAMEGMGTTCRGRYDYLFSLFNGLIVNEDGGFVNMTIDKSTIKATLMLQSDGLRPVSARGDDVSAVFNVDFHFDGSASAAFLEMFRFIINPMVSKIMGDSIADILKQSIDVNLTQGFQDFNNATAPAFAPRTPDEEVPADPEEQFVQWTKSPLLSIVDGVINHWLLETPQPANCLFGYLSNNTGVISIPLGDGNVTFTIPGLANVSIGIKVINITGLNTWTDLHVLALNVSNPYTIDNHLALTKLGLAAPIRLTVTPLDNTIEGPILDESFNFAVKLSDLLLRATLRPVVRKADYGPLTINQLASNASAACIASAAWSTNITNLVFDSILEDAVLEPAAPGEDHLADDFNRLISAFVHSFAVKFAPFYNKLTYGLVDNMLRDSLNADMEALIPTAKEKCAADSPAPPPPRIAQWIDMQECSLIQFISTAVNELLGVDGLNGVLGCMWPDNGTTPFLTSPKPPSPFVTKPFASRVPSSSSSLTKPPPNPFPIHVFEWRRLDSFFKMELLNATTERLLLNNIGIGYMPPTPPVPEPPVNITIRGVSSLPSSAPHSAGGEGVKQVGINDEDVANESFLSRLSPNDAEKLVAEVRTLIKVATSPSTQPPAVASSATAAAAKSLGEDVDVAATVASAAGHMLRLAVHSIARATGEQLMAIPTAGMLPAKLMSALFPHLADHYAANSHVAFSASEEDVEDDDAAAAMDGSYIRGVARGRSTRAGRASAHLPLLSRLGTNAQAAAAAAAAGIAEGEANELLPSPPPAPFDVHLQRKPGEGPFTIFVSADVPVGNQYVLLNLTLGLSNATIGVDVRFFVNNDAILNMTMAELATPICMICPLKHMYVDRLHLDLDDLFIGMAITLAPNTPTVAFNLSGPVFMDVVHFLLNQTFNITRTFFNQRLAQALFEAPFRCAKQPLPIAYHDDPEKSKLWIYVIVFVFAGSLAVLGLFVLMYRYMGKRWLFACGCLNRCSCCGGKKGSATGKEGKVGLLDQVSDLDYEPKGTKGKTGATSTSDKVTDAYYPMADEPVPVGSSTSAAAAGAASAKSGKSSAPVSAYRKAPAHSSTNTTASAGAEDVDEDEAGIANGSAFGLTDRDFVGAPSFVHEKKSADDDDDKGKKEDTNNSPLKPSPLPAFKSSEVYSGLMFSPALHGVYRYGVLFTILGNIVLFAYSNSQIGASVTGLLTVTDTKIDFGSFFDFTLTQTAADMWNAGVYALFFLIAAMSGGWPYLKLVLCLACWILPADDIPPNKRETILIWLDRLGKWSLIDAFVLVLMVVAFRFHLNLLSEDVAFDVIVKAKMGFYAFTLGTMVSLALSHIILAFHRHVTTPFVIQDGGPRVSVAAFTHSLGRMKLSNPFLASFIVDSEVADPSATSKAIAASTTINNVTLNSTGSPYVSSARIAQHRAGRSSTKTSNRNASASSGAAAAAAASSVSTASGRTLRISPAQCVIARVFTSAARADEGPMGLGVVKESSESTGSSGAGSDNSSNNNSLSSDKTASSNASSFNKSNGTGASSASSVASASGSSKPGSSFQTHVVGIDVDVAVAPEAVEADPLDEKVLLFVRCSVLGRVLTLLMMTVACGLIVWGTFVDSFEFQFQGLAGWLLNDEDTRIYSIWSVGIALVDSSPDSTDIGIRWTQAVFFTFALGVPLLFLCVSCFHFFARLTIRSHRAVHVLSEVLFAWSALEVLFVSLLAAVLQISTFAQFIIGKNCDLINMLLELYFKEPLHGHAVCFNLQAYFQPGAWILLGATVAFLIAGHITFKTSSSALKDRIREYNFLVRQEAAARGLVLGPNGSFVRADGSTVNGTNHTDADGSPDLPMLQAIIAAEDEEEVDYDESDDVASEEGEGEDAKNKNFSPSGAASAESSKVSWWRRCCKSKPGRSCMRPTLWLVKMRLLELSAHPDSNVHIDASGAPVSAAGGARPSAAAAAAAAASSGYVPPSITSTGGSSGVVIHSGSALDGTGPAPPLVAVSGPPGAHSRVLGQQGAGQPDASGEWSSSQLAQAAL